MTHVAVGDFSGTGSPGLAARTSSGSIVLYPTLCSSSVTRTAATLPSAAVLRLLVAKRTYAGGGVRADLIVVFADSTPPRQLRGSQEGSNAPLSDVVVTTSNYVSVGGAVVVDYTGGSGEDLVLTTVSAMTGNGALAYFHDTPSSPALDLEAVVLTVPNLEGVAASRAGADTVLWYVSSSGSGLFRHVVSRDGGVGAMMPSWIGRADPSMFGLVSAVIPPGCNALVGSTMSSLFFALINGSSVVDAGFVSGATVGVSRRMLFTNYRATSNAAPGVVALNFAPALYSVPLYCTGSTVNMTQVAASGTPNDIAVGDFDRNGFDDLVIALDAMPGLEILQSQ